MSINSVTTSTKIRRTALGSVPGYNTLQQGLVDLAITSYGGQSLESRPVDSDSLIKAAEWKAWQNDFQRISVHQNHSLIDFNGFSPEQGQKARAAIANKIITEFNTAWENSTTVAVQQLGASTLQGSSYRDSLWNSEISQIVRYTWSTSDQAKNYFNLGSYIAFIIDPSGGTSNSQDILWNSLIQSAKTRLANFKYGWQQWTSPSQVLYAKYDGLNLVWDADDNGTIVYDDSNGLENYIKLSATRDLYLGDPALTINLSLTPELLGGQDISVNVNATFTNWYSRGDVPVGGTFGFAAPQPTVVRLEDLGQGGTEGPPPPNRSITVSPLFLSYNFQRNTQSSPQTVTIQNSGNVVATVTNITFFNSNGPVTPSLTSFPLFPVTLSPSASISFGLSYSSAVQGTFNNSFRVTPRDLAPITVNTQQVVVAPAFDYTVTPSSWTININNSSVVNQFFQINPNDGVPVNSNYTMSLSYSPLAPDPWSLGAVEATGRRVSFDPRSLPSGGTYTANLQVSHRGVNKTISISITVTLLVTQNLGTWRSGLQKDNGVVGMSYDIIGGQRYLTIGYGLGADGAPKSATLDNDSAFYALAQVANLGVNGDSGYNFGPVVYTPGVFTFPTGNVFFQNYGAWVRDSNYYLDNLGPNSTGIVGFNVSRNYTFTTPGGSHYWQFAAHTGGRFFIDGILIFDLPSDSGGAFLDESNGVISLTAGTHSVTWLVYPGSNPDESNGLALRITLNGQEVYSTRNSIRTSPAYRYWSEVYRIPIKSNGDGVTETLYAGGRLGQSNYRIKNYQECAGFAYGDVFDDFMFKIVNDSFGNLDISFGVKNENDSGSIWQWIKTAGYGNDIRYLNYLKYLSVTDENNLVRLINVGTPIPPSTSQTYIFTGFNRDGTQKLILSNRPRFTFGGGGGGGGGIRPPIIIDLF